MDLALESLQREAMIAEAHWLEPAAGRERIAGARRFGPSIRAQTHAAIGDFTRISEGSLFSPKEAAGMLGDTCLQACSYLFAAGAPTRVWRTWCALAGRSFALGSKHSDALQLCTIARYRLEDRLLAEIETADFRSYRESVIRFITLGKDDAMPPADPPQLLAPDDAYAALARQYRSNDRAAMENSIAQIARFWLDEIDTETFEPGVFPVFDPQVNSVVAALKDKGHQFNYSDLAIQEFLAAGLE